jgi:hypothetical protein
MEPQAQQSPVQEQPVQESPVQESPGQGQAVENQPNLVNSAQGSRHTECADGQGSRHTPCADHHCTPPACGYPVPRTMCDGTQPPANMPAATARRRATRRHRKAILLPEIAQLALEGQTGKAIALRFDLPTRTVNHWLHEVRSQWLAAATQRGVDSMAAGLARLNGIYREAMEAWRRAQAEIQPLAKTKRQATGGDGAATKKASRRRQASDALLGRAISVAGPRISATLVGVVDADGRESVVGKLSRCAG